VLLTLLLEALGFTEVPLGLLHLLLADGLLLRVTSHVVPVLQLALLHCALLGNS
jgi:hypothetical protein